MKNKINIVWFKRDLRIHDHAPLHDAALESFPVLPLYVVEPGYWRQPFSSSRHWNFIYDCLAELLGDCANLGQPLVIRVGDIVEVLKKLDNIYNINGIYAHEETGNSWTYNRDKKVIEWCIVQSIPIYEYPCNGVVRRLKNRDNWSKIRNTRIAKPLIPKPQRLESIPGIPLGDIPSKSNPIFGTLATGITQKGGRRAAIKTLKRFLEERGKEYIYHLSAPGKSEKYCSRLSPHLTWGTLSVREVIQSNQKRRKGLTTKETKAWKRNLSAFGSRLSWRCHFVQKIEDQPSIELECMHPAFEGLRENEHNEKFYQAWEKGQTGYPFIDACMRNLIYEGWITFRMRAMLVSFASYHLWLDWRKTGYHLARLFTDYEPGIHYSQLQMQSGVTGINTLRIYNPIKQSQEHDKTGAFIRQWLPELQYVPNTWIHEPFRMDLSMQRDLNCIIGRDYPSPIVNHTHAVKSARAKIVFIQKQEGFRDNSEKVYQKLGSRKRPLKKIKSSNSNRYQLSFKI
jgi:deoxyribodipyrimidine photo-lyase